MSDLEKCRLCGLPVARSDARLEMEGKIHFFCCMGCLYVYQILSGRPQGPPSDFRETDLYNAAVAAGVIPGRIGDETGDVGEEEVYPEEFLQETYFRIEGMWCTACSFLIEEVLRKRKGVVEAEVSFSSDLVRIRFLPHRINPQEAMDEVAKLGYRAFRFDEDSERSIEKRNMLVRLGVSSILSMNIMGISFVLYAGLFQDIGQEAIAYVSYPLWIMATAVLLYGGSPIFRRAFAGLRHGTGSMDTLISIGSLAAYLYSLFRMRQGSVHLYFDTAAMLITLVLLGRTIEAQARDRVTRGIHELYRLARQKVRLVDGIERWAAPEAVRRGDHFKVKQGERPPVDGRMSSGRTAVDESFLTGESRPVTRITGDVVTAGSLILGEDAELEAVSDGSTSTLSQMVRLLQEALALKNQFELLADRITRMAVPAVLLLAGATALCLPAFGISWGESMLRAVTVLVITCPCALGIATPLARVASLGAARKEGILIGGPNALEKARNLKAMVLDKTGTVTEGRFALRHMMMEEEISREEGLILASAVESHSDHFIAREILEKAKALSLEWGECSRFESFEGMGVGGVVKGMEVLVGNQSLIRSQGWVITPSMNQKAGELERSGQTVVFLAWGGRARGLLSFGDALRKDALRMVGRLQSRGMEVWLVSGDSAGTTAAVAEMLKIDRHAGQALPADKVKIVQSLQGMGKRVGMVGDGINDAAALAQADVGFALGAASNLLQQASDVTIITRDLQKVLDTLDLSAFTMRVVRQNLFFSFLYNGLGIPLAIAGFLNPILAAIAMFASSLTVIGNTIRITKRKVHSA